MFEIKSFFEPPGACGANRARRQGVLQLARQAPEPVGSGDKVTYKRRADVGRSVEHGLNGPLMKPGFLLQPANDWITDENLDLGAILFKEHCGFQSALTGANHKDLLTGKTTQVLFLGRGGH